MKDFAKSIGFFEQAQWKGVDDNDDDDVVVVAMTATMATMATQKGKREIRGRERKEKISNWNLGNKWMK